MKGRAPNKEVTELIRKLERQGFLVRRARSGHYRVTAQDGRTWTLSSSPRSGVCPRTVAGLRRIGAQL